MNLKILKSLFIIFFLSVSAVAANVSETYNEANNYYWNKDYVNAAKYYRLVINKYPESTFYGRSLFGLGSSFFAMENYKMAMKAYSQLIDEQPKSNLADDAVFRLAECYEKTGDVENSSKYYRRLIDRYPDSMLVEQAKEKIAKSPRKLTLSKKEIPAVKPEEKKGAKPEVEEKKKSKPGIEEKKYIVKPEDTLTSIAAEFYGDYNKYAVIANYNNIKSPFDLKPGQKLIIPLEKKPAPDWDLKGSKEKKYSDEMIYKFKLEKEKLKFNKDLLAEQMKNKKLKKVMERLKTEITKLNLELDSYKNKLKSANIYKNKIDAEKKSMQETADMLKKEKQRVVLIESKYKAEIIKLQNQIAELNKKVQQERERTSDTYKVITTRDQEVKRLNTEIRDNMVTIKNLKADKDILYQQIRELENQVSDLKKSNKQLDEKTKTLNSQLLTSSKGSSDLEKKTAEYEKELKEKNKFIIKLKTEYALNQKKELDNDRLKLTIDKKDAEIRVLKEKENDLLNEIESYKVLKEKNKDLMKQNEKIVSEMSELKKEKIKMAEELLSLKRKFVNIKKTGKIEGTTGTEEIDTIEKRLKELSGENLELKKENMKLRTEKFQLLNKIGEMPSGKTGSGPAEVDKELFPLRAGSKSNVMEENKRLNSEIADLKEKLEEAENKLMILNKNQLKNQEIKTLLEKGISAASRKSYEEAEKYYQEILKQEPKNIDAIVGLGNLYLEKEDKLDRAIGYFNKAIELNPSSKGYYYDSIGWINYKQGRYEKSLDILKQAKTMIPDIDSKAKARVLYHLGSVYFKMGDSDNAFFQFIDVLKLVSETSELGKKAKQQLDLL